MILCPLPDAHDKPGRGTARKREKTSDPYAFLLTPFSPFPHACCPCQLCHTRTGDWRERRREIWGSRALTTTCNPPATTLLTSGNYSTIRLFYYIFLCTLSGRRSIQVYIVVERHDSVRLLLTDRLFCVLIFDFSSPSSSALCCSPQIQLKRTIRSPCTPSFPSSRLTSLSFPLHEKHPVLPM